MDEGGVIAEGLGTQLGETPAEHLEFIVRTIPRSSVGTAW